MKRFKTSMAVLIAGLPFLSNRSEAASLQQGVSPAPDQLDPVKLRPLNLPGDNLFAAHRSHSSHSSHRSSSGGGSAYPQPRPDSDRAPTQRGPASSLYSGEGASQPVDPGRAAPVAPRPAYPSPAPLSKAEKLRLQVMRVQIGLTSLGLYTGPVDGVFDEATKESLKRFQIVKGVKPDGLMNTDTLNALGVPAVQ